MPSSKRAASHATAGLIAGPGTLVLVVLAAAASADLSILTGDHVPAGCAIAVLLAHFVSLLEVAVTIVLLRRSRWPLPAKLLLSNWLAVGVAAGVRGVVGGG